MNAVEPIGGMFKKYEHLVHNLTSNSNGRIVGETRNSLRLILYGESSSIEYNITENAESLTIEIIAKLGVLGIRNHKLSYSNNCTQDKMLEDIYNYWAENRNELFDFEGNETLLGSILLSSKINPNLSKEDIKSNAEIFFIIGEKKLINNDFNNAIKYFSNAIDIYPQYAKAYLKRGISKFSLGDIRGSIADYTFAIEISPYDSMSYYNRGLSFFELNKIDTAIDDFSRAIEFDSNNAIIYYNRGSARFVKNDFKGAILDFSQAIEIDNNYSNAYGRRGLAKLQSDDFNGAIIDLDIAISLNPNDREALANRGLLKYSFGDSQGAYSDWDIAVKLGSDLAKKFITEFRR